MDGRETVGNSLGRAPWGRSGTEATTRLNAGKACEIAWGELRYSRKEPDGSDDRVDGGETVGMGELR